MTQATEFTSTRPYLIRAWHEWCSDNRLTPYVSVAVNPSVQVPREYVKNGEIVLNIGFNATTALSMGNEYLEFKARFSGVVRDIMVPMDQILAIFASETGQGMAFPSIASEGLEAQISDPVESSDNANARASHLASVADVPSALAPADAAPAKPSARPTLTRVK